MKATPATPVEGGTAPAGAGPAGSPVVPPGAARSAISGGSSRSSERVISSLPSKIPDGLLADIEEFDEGDHVLASHLVLPEDVALAVDPETEIGVISGVRADAEEVPAEEGEEGEALAEGEEAPAPEE